MYGIFDQYFGRCIIWVDLNGREQKGILLNKDGENFKVEIGGEVKSIKVDEIIDTMKVVGYRTFIKHRISYNEGFPVTAIVYRNDKPIDDLIQNIKKDQAELYRPMHTDSQCWYAEIYHEGEMYPFEDRLKRNRFISDKIDGGETISLWEWEWIPDNHWNEKCRKEDCGEWRLNWHTSLPEEDDTPILFSANCSWNEPTRIIGRCSRIYFYDPAIALEEQDFEGGWPYHAYIDLYDDQKKAVEVIKRWPFGFQYVETERESFWRYRTEDLLIQVQRLDSLEGPLPAPRLFNQIAFSKAYKLWVTCQKDELNRAVVKDCYNRTIVLDSPLLKEEKSGQCYIQAYGRKVGNEYHIRSFECEHETACVNTRSAPPFTIRRHQVWESE